jgi:hypothetical protein
MSASDMERAKSHYGPPFMCSSLIFVWACPVYEYNKSRIRKIDPNHKPSETKWLSLSYTSKQVSGGLSLGPNGRNDT